MSVRVRGDEFLGNDHSAPATFSLCGVTFPLSGRLFELKPPLAFKGNPPWVVVV